MTIGDGSEVFTRFQTSWVPSAGLLAEDGNWLAVRAVLGILALTAVVGLLVRRRVSTAARRRRAASVAVQ
jgi:hypothetical protein